MNYMAQKLGETIRETIGSSVLADHGYLDTQQLAPKTEEDVLILREKGEKFHHNVYQFLPSNDYCKF